MISVLDACMMIAGLVFLFIPFVTWTLDVVKEESSKFHAWKWLRPHCGANPGLTV